MLDQEIIDRLKEKYKEYNFSSEFINICFNSLDEAGFKTKEITSFIFNHFTNIHIQHRSCNKNKIIFLLNLHVSNSKFQIDNNFYKSYKLSATNAIKYRIILKEYKNFKSF